MQKHKILRQNEWIEREISEKVDRRLREGWAGMSRYSFVRKSEELSVGEARASLHLHTTLVAASCSSLTAFLSFLFSRQREMRIR